MTQINLTQINWTKVLHYTITIVLCIILFGKCTENKELQLSSAMLKKEAAQHEANAQKYVDKINALNDKVTILETKKQKVKKEIVYVEKKTQTKLEKIPSLTTKGIAVYYQKRYETPVVITQYGVALPDSVAKQNIKETIERDGCFEEIKLVKDELAIEEQKSAVKDTINHNLTMANIELKKANHLQKRVTKNAEKSFRREKNKKTFWQVVAGVAISIATYTAVVK